ncbi:MAG: protein kinase [Proteobacteria bacterium]|nr:protein kinase [Pseudomonadota bacterium]MCP4921751.1 protein kinase [Pseudomonadota bacterium]
MRQLDDRYRLIAPIGRGGVGEVYEGLQIALDRRVAIKLLRPELTMRAEVVSRFEREARTTCRLSHPNVVTVFDVGVAQGGGRYLVMELLDGRTLAEVIRHDGPMALEDALDIATQIARGMGAGQGVGLVHRDLKPENVMVLAEQRVKILDFGLATLQQGKTDLQEGSVDEALRRSVDSLPPGAPSLETMAPMSDTWVDTPKPPLESQASSRLTRAGALVGTPRYMAPEQALAWEVDHRADIYAFGCVLFEALTGRAPFEEDTVHEYLAAHVHKPPPRPSLSAEVPAPLEQLILRCLEKDPGSRFADWAALSEELRRIQGVALPQTQRRTRKSERRPDEPYRFLQPFSSATASIFFGRDRDAERFLTTWEHPDQVPIVALTGSSGVGKTSFLYARVIPALEDIGHEVLVVRGGESPTRALARAVERRLARSSGERTERTERALPMLLDELAALEGRPVAVVFDQLEELFTVGTTTDQAQFQADLAAVVGAGEASVRFVLSLREDFLGQLLRALYPLPTDQLLRAMPLRPLRPEDLRQALEGPGREGLPVEYAPFSFEPGLAVEIVQDLLEDDAGEVAPRVQAVGARLWAMVREEMDPVITRDHYRSRLGGARAILARLLDEAIGDLDPTDQGLAKELLRALTHLPGSATSRPASQAGLLAAHSDVTQVSRVLDRLESRWRIIQGYADPRWPDERAYRIAHEALIARIQDYGEEASERNRARQLFLQGFELWLKNGRKEQDLLLEEHFAVVQRHVGELVLRNADQDRFYRASHTRNIDSWEQREIVEKKKARMQLFWRWGLPVVCVVTGWVLGQVPTDFSAAGAQWVRTQAFLGTDRAGFQGLTLRYAQLREVELLAPDFTEADLSGADLTDADLEQAIFARARLAQTSLDGASLLAADLSGAYVLGASFRQADLRKANVDLDPVGADFVGAIFDGATDWHGDPPRGAVGPGADVRMMALDGMAFEKLDLTGLHGREAHASGTSFRESYLVGAELPDLHAPGATFAYSQLGAANLGGAVLTRASFAQADLTNASLAGADLSGAVLVGARLGAASLGGAELTGAIADARTNWPSGYQPTAMGVVLLAPGLPLEDLDLAGLDLSGASLAGLDLSGADLSGATLRGVSLKGTDLTGANLAGADLSEASLVGADLTGASTDGVIWLGANTAGMKGAD